MTQNRMPEGRFFSDVYDCSAQVAEAPWGRLDGMRHYLARIRLDVFVYGKVIIKDSDLVDGSFFLQLAASNLLHQLPLERIEIKARSPNLDDALIGTFR